MSRWLNLFAPAKVAAIATAKQWIEQSIRIKWLQNLIECK